MPHLDDPRVTDKNNASVDKIRFLFVLKINKFVLRGTRILSQYYKYYEI